jgi:hypothetical protein
VEYTCSKPFTLRDLYTIYTYQTRWIDHRRILDPTVVLPVSYIVSLSSDVNSSDAQNGVTDRHGCTPHGGTIHRQYLDLSRTRDTLLSSISAKVVTPYSGASQALY